jgi:ligand-binding sensor domain-containing protein
MLCCAAIISSAQQLSFETLTVRNGLSSNEVTCVYEDKDHFMWIGTRDGLNRFDGRIFTIFRNKPDDANSLSGNFIVSMVQDKQGILWIATKDGGLTRYDSHAGEGKEFRQFKNSSKDSTSIATNRLNCLYDWDENYLLIGAEAFPGIFLNKKTFEFTYWEHLKTGLHPKFCKPSKGVAFNWIQHIEEADSNTIYVSLLTNGTLLKVNKATGELTALHNTPQDVLSINDFIITNNRLWMCSWNVGLFTQVDTFTNTASRISPINDLLICIANYNKDFLLAGTRSSGLYLVNKTSGQAVLYDKSILQQHSIPSNKINSIYIDSRGIVWVGTSAGLAKFNKQEWLFNESEFTDPETDCTILHSHRFNNGSIALNTSKGMFLSDSTQTTFTNLTFKTHNISIVPDYLLETKSTDIKLKSGELYNKPATLLGTEIGFYIWEQKSNLIKEVYTMHPLGFPIDFYKDGVFQVKQLLQDTIMGKPVIWMPVLGFGLGVYDITTGQLNYFIKQDTGTTNPIGNNLARRIAKDKQGNIWVATAGGLFRWNRSNGEPCNKFDAFINEPGNKNSIPNNDVNDVWCDDNNHIWLTLNSGGLCEFNGTKFIQYLPTNPVSSATFLGIYPDNRNRLWIITKNGLEIFDKSTKQFSHMDVNDGLSNTSLTPHFSNAVNGIVSFTAGNRVFTFKPSEMLFDNIYPQVYLAGMDVFGKSYLQQALTGGVFLKPNQRFVNFTVSALQFNFPATVRFQYKLEGLDENWNSSDDGEIKYTNLPWGKFKLLVRVSNPSGNFGGETKLAEFTIATPFYATWWFICLCIAATGGVIYLVYRYRINQLLAMQKVRNKIARDLHDDIGSTLGSISFFSEAAKQQLLQQNTTGAEKMLGKIGDTSREMIDNMSDIVWSVNPNNDSLKHLLERMRVFASDLVASAEIMLHFKYDEQIAGMKLSMEQRKNIYLVFKETIYNSVKYADCKNIYIEVSKHASSMQMVIRDDGKGFDVNNYTSKNGNGLRNMKHRATEIEALYDIQSSPQGTVTTLTIY